MFICGFVFYKSIIAAVCVMAFSAAGVRAYRRSLAEKRKMQLRAEFKDFLYSVSSSVSSGRHLNEAIGDAEHSVSLIHGSDSLMTREIRNMKRIMTETNCSEDVVLTDLAKRSKIREIADFSDVCITCKYTGGDLTRMIGKAVYLLT